MKNPFNYLQFARGEQFYDRKEILMDLRSRFLSGQTNVVLYGPRRYGKSSLVAELSEMLEQQGMLCITFDMVKMATLDIFVNGYAEKLYRKLAPVRFGVETVRDFFRRLRPQVTFGADGEIGVSFETAGAEMSAEALSEVLDLPQRLADGRRVLVIMDEFQEVEHLLPNDGFERVMRSVIQTHRDVSYLFLGSRHHLLRRMFTDHHRPFYKSALTILLDKPPQNESVTFVMERFASVGFSIDEKAADKLVAKIENIPYYIQQLGFETFRIVDEASRTHAVEADVEAAYTRLSGFNRDQYEQQMLSFSQAQKKLLIALAHEETATFDRDYKARHHLGISSTVNSAKKKLIEDGYIEHLREACRISDPFFAEYLRTE